jgi:beta-lactamase regulating signal transducer with metallopeptidase domain
MMTFIIKSTVCLLVLYGFYLIFLSHQKILLFNRFYLIFSLVVSLVGPQITIPVKGNFPLNSNFEKLSITTSSFIQGEAIVNNSASLFRLQNILIAIFILVSSIQLTRFLINILRIAIKISKNQKVLNESTTYVLVEEETLPYSFFRYIFINKSDFQNGKIERELLLHEEAHCLHYHSVDIIIIELLNVFLWFNPLIWFIKKSILLNHEFYADNSVIKDTDPISYQKLLVNIIIRNNSNLLVSNFKYSFIKSRLKMMANSNPLHNIILRKISAISLILILTITVTCRQETIKTDYDMDYEDAWWYPILKTENISPHAFNTFDPVFEMGTTNSIDGRIVTLENAFFLIKKDSINYTIIRTSLGYHDLDKNIIYGDKRVIIEDYKWDSEAKKPSKILTSTSTGFEYHIGNKK